MRVFTCNSSCFDKTYITVILEMIVDVFSFYFRGQDNKNMAYNSLDANNERAIVEHAKDADLFICEGMYGEPEKKAKAVEYKHMTFYEAAEMAKKACVREMWLTHYSPSLVRPEPYMEEVRKIFAAASAGKDGKSTTLLFEEE